MNTKKSTVIAVLVGLAAFMVLAGMALTETGPFARTTTAAPPDAIATPAARDLGPVIAEANGEPIYLGEIESRVQGVTTVHGGLEDALGKDWPDKLLQNVVDDKIVEQQADELGIVVTESELQAHIDDIRTSYFGSQEEYQEWLAEGQMDEAEFRDRVLLQTLAARLFRKVTDSVEITKDQARSYYEEHREDYPGYDGTGAPFFAVREDIEKELEKQEREAMYGTWLEDQRSQVAVVVVMNDWWKEIS